MRAHDADTPKFQALGEVENRAPLEQRCEGVLGCKRRSLAEKCVGDPGRGDPSANNALPGVGLETIDARRFTRQPFPDRGEQSCGDMDRALWGIRNYSTVGTP